MITKTRKSKEIYHVAALSKTPQSKSECAQSTQCPFPLLVHMIRNKPWRINNLSFRFVFFFPFLKHVASCQITSPFLCHISAISSTDTTLLPVRSLLIKLCVFTAIWMLPRDSVYGGWPRSGEIDIMESKGNDLYVDGSGVNVGNTLMGSTLHWGPDSSHNNYWRTHWEKWVLVDVIQLKNCALNLKKLITLDS